MKIIDGRTIAQEIIQKTKEKMKKSGKGAGLAIILIGDDPASRLYISLKEKACAEIGAYFEKHLFESGEKKEAILRTIQSLNQRDDIHGILVQLPLPQGYNEDEMILAIDPKKDVDGFHPENLKLFLDGNLRIWPVTAKAITVLIESTGENLKNKFAVIMTNSQTFAAPIKKFLEDRDIKTKIILYDPTLPISRYAHISQADILITAVGKPKLISALLVKNGAIVIDVGISRINVGSKQNPIWRTSGDIDFESFKEKTGFITPVPGGVGPVTIAILLDNLVELSLIKANV